METLLKKFQKYAKTKVHDYIIDDENKDVIHSLLLYFTGNPEFEKVSLIKDPSLKKGICLTGNIGTGKTLLMQIIGECKIKGKTFGYKTCREIARRFMTEGYNGIVNFGSGAVRREYQNYKISHMLFDDLGSERSLTSYYGNKVNVMGEILTDRYELFLKHGLITHLTTNLDFDELEEIYGNRVLSRMKQMFNFVVLGGSKDSKDRRIK